MSANNDKTCCINRVRLLNFHNFTNVTINLNDVGGHLFMMGDNGSGKTTVLDAIHYVLTAGEKMEFNAAARVAGNKQLGRRAQGLITRFNVDTGHMRPSGGVTYAALEIKRTNGSVTTAAIGMSVNSPNDALTRWFVLKDAPLEDIPFLVKDPEGERPRDKEEMKKALGGAGYFGQPSSYCNTLSERFLGGRANFNDFCRFLSMGKAYREIASHTSDYQTLFMRLLPESDFEIFEKIIISLKAIDENRATLKDLDDKLDYVRSLITLLNEIGESNVLAATFDAVELFIKLKHLQDQIVGYENKIKECDIGLKSLSEIELETRAERNRAETALNELKEKDSTGAVTREKELRGRLEVLQEQRQASKMELEENRKKVAELAEKRDAASNKLIENLAALMRKLPEKSINSGVETASLAVALESVVHGADPDEVNIENTLDDAVDRARALISAEQPKLARLDARMETLNGEIAELAEKERILLENKEAIPEWNGFASLAEELDANAILFSPVYKGLEWHPDLTDAMKARVEEFIGEEALTVVAVAENEYDRAADIIFNDYPGHKLAVLADIRDVPREFREWATSVFDVNACDPTLLGILLLELSTKTPPEFTTWEDVDIVKFRGRERSFTGVDARFIGADSREKTQKLKLKEIRADINELRADQKEFEDERKKLKSKIRTAANLEKLLAASLSDTRSKIAEKREVELSHAHESENLERAKGSFERLDAEFAELNKRHASLLKRIQAGELREIENQITQAVERLKKIDAEMERMRRECAKLALSRETAEESLVAREIEATGCRTAYDEQLFLLENRYSVAEPAEHVEELRSKHKLHVERDAANLANERRIAVAETQATLKGMVNDILGVNYGFSYDQNNNELFTRDNVPIRALQESLAKDLEDQHKLINDKTTELFKKLIVDTMLRALAEKVHELERMQRYINGLLKDRMFGNNTYKIRIKPRERYESLVKMIKTLSFYSEGTERIENFFEDYKHEIMETPPGEIPPMLDYRNWYSYEMCVYAASGEEAVMNSRVKSVGSGGEQAVPNYLLVLTIAHFMFSGSNIKLNTLLFDEAFYGIDSQRKDQLMGFATDLGLQLFVASPDQDGVKDEIAYSTSLLVVKDSDYEIHLFPYHWKNPEARDLFEQDEREPEFTKEL